VWLAKAKPRKVFRIKEVDYFYWRWGGLHAYDYEPVRVYSSHNSLVLSRYHWHVLTIWTKPRLHEGRPIAEFTIGLHTPLVYSKGEPQMNIVTLTSPAATKDPEADEFYWLETAVLPYIKSMWRRSHQTPQDELFGYKSILETEKKSKAAVRPKYLLKISKMKLAVIFGPLPRPENLPEFLSKRIWPDN